MLTAASSHCVSVCVASTVSWPVLSWFTAAAIPPLSELCVWVTRPAGVFATACRLLIWSKIALFSPVPLPVGCWFCSMSSATLAPFCATFSLWVIGPEPVAVEVTVCVWVIALPVQLPEESAACFAQLWPPSASWVTVTDWCASSDALTGVPLNATVEASMLIAW